MLVAIIIICIITIIILYYSRYLPFQQVDSPLVKHIYIRCYPTACQQDRVSWNGDS